MADDIRGIIELQKHFEQVSKKAQKEIPEMLDDLAEPVRAWYVKNLSGPVPSTATKPLPVGVRTGKLRAGAKTVKAHPVGGGLLESEVRNDVRYSGFWSLARAS